MKEKIVQTAVGITIIAAGRSRSKQITKSLEFAPFLLAADGGAKKALKYGTVPDAIIGDFDSMKLADLPIDPERFYQIFEQDSTDFEKCLYSLDAPFVIAHGVTGSRLDHSLAAMTAICKFRNVALIVVSGKDIIFLCPSELSLTLPKGTRLSLFPMGEVSGTAQGLEYPIDGIKFAPDGLIGTSNRTKGGVTTLGFDAPRMLVILPWKHLGIAVSALSSKTT